MGSSFQNFISKLLFFLKKISFTFCKLCFSPAFINYWMLLGKIFILFPRDPSYVTGFIDWGIVIIESFKKKVHFKRIFPPRVSSWAHPQSQMLLFMGECVGIGIVFLWIHT